MTVRDSGLAVDANDATSLTVDVLDVSTTGTLLQGRSVAGLSLSNVTASISDGGASAKPSICRAAAPAIFPRQALLWTTPLCTCLDRNHRLHRGALACRQHDTPRTRSRNGHLDADTMTVLGEGGVLFRDLDTSIQDMHVDLGQGAGPAVDLMAGDHVWGDVVLERR